MREPRTCPRAIGALAILLIGISQHPAAADWNQWRGPQRDGRVVGFKPPARWPKQLTRHWRVTVGIGHASPLAVRDSAYVFSREGGAEVVRRLALATGREVWKQRYPAPYTVNPAAQGHGAGPKSTPLYHAGRLYTLGISGILSCFDAASGTVRWRQSFSRQYRETSPEFGTAASPVVADGMLIAHVGGKQGGALTAFDAATGRVRWRWTGDGPAYASPIIATVGGVRQVVTQSQSACIGVALATGQLLWRVPFTTPYEQNSVTPVAVGDTLVFGGLQQPTFACRIRRSGAAWTVDRLWQTRDATLYMNTPVVLGKQLYGLSERRRGQLFSLDPATGRVGWTGPGRFAENAALLTAGSCILALTTDANLHVYQPRGAALAETARYRVADSPTWASPAVLGRRLLVKDATMLTLWEIRG